MTAILELQKYTDRGWLRLDEDNGSIEIPSTAWSYSYGRGILAGNECRGQVIRPSVEEPNLKSKRGVIRVPLPRLPTVKAGALTLTLNLKPTADADAQNTCSGLAPVSATPLGMPLGMTHLLTNRGAGTNFNQNPQARMVWGVSKQVWMRRQERFN
jgi:hypothetical protein